MSEDYLWDKTGDDAEIRRLENLLSVFKYEETEPPVPAAAVLPERKWGWAMSLRFAFAAGFAAAFIAGTVFVLLPNVEIAIISTIDPPQVPTQSSSAGFEGPEKAELPKAPAMPKPSGAVRIVSKRSVDPRPVRKIIASRRPAREQPSALTADEKYAYNQLMLALSITGSKLKIVKDTINGTDSARNVPDKSSK